ncbi:MAG: hypothetical protein RRZ84_05030 [Romboutsia sp.]
MIKGVEIHIVDGDYINDIDKYIVKLDDKLKLSMGDYIKIPNYSKHPNLKFKVLDNRDIISIDGNNMTTLKEGYASIGVMNGSGLLKKATVKVVNPKVEDLELNIDEDLIYVGDSANISSIIEVDYKGFKESPKVNYRSSNEDILEVEGNKIKAVGVGKATLYATSGDKEEEISYRIKARVGSIDIEKDIKIEVNETIKLNPSIETSPEGLKHPRVEYTLVGSKLPISRAIGLNNSDGTITAIRPGEEIVKITCGNKSIMVNIKVVEENISNKAIENLDVSKEIIGDKMIITIVWDYIKGINDYDIYVRNNSLGQGKFEVIKSRHIKEEDRESIVRVESTVEIDISNMDEVDLDLYVVGKNDKGITKPSKIEKIAYTKEQESINDLVGNFDKLNNTVQLTWRNIEKEDIVYRVYIKNNLRGDSDFNLYADEIISSEYTINTIDGEADMDVYIVAIYGNKIIRSNTIKIK